MDTLKDFTYDYSNLISHKWPIGDNEYFDKLIKSYLFTHQFSEDVVINEYDLLKICEYFLDDGEYVFKNDDKLLFILNGDLTIDTYITFLKWIMTIMSINIKDYSVINLEKKINLLLILENYENTFNGRRTEELYI